MVLIGLVLLAVLQVAAHLARVIMYFLILIHLLLLGQSIKIDIDNAGVNDMTWTGVTDNPTFNFNGKNLDVFGSVVFAENMTINSANMDFMGTSSATLDTKNKNISTIYLKGSGLNIGKSIDIQKFLHKIWFIGYQ